MNNMLNRFWSVWVFKMICGSLSAGQVAMPAKSGEKIVFPEAEWAKGVPEACGISQKALAGLDELMKKAEANGVLIRNGLLIAEWKYSALPDPKINVKSITKCMTGILYGLALGDGLIPDHDTKVRDLWPDFNVGPYAAEITFDNLASATSGLKTTGPYWQHFISHGSGKEFRLPGMPSEYHNDHVMYLAGALTYLFEQDLLEVLRTRVLKKIGADAEWVTNGEGAPKGIGNHGTFRSLDSNDPFVPPGYVTLRDGRQVRWVTGFARSRWTAGDLARVGWLFLNDGNWNGEQLIPLDFAKECRRHVPDRKYLAWRTVPVPGQNDWWFMSGSGGQFCVLIPEHNIVLSKINDWPNKSNGTHSSRPDVGLKAFVPLLSGIMAGDSSPK